MHSAVSDAAAHVLRGFEFRPIWACEDPLDVSECRRELVSLAEDVPNIAPRRFDVAAGTEQRTPTLTKRSTTEMTLAASPRASAMDMTHSRSW